jgi:glycosyltransferase involved in cell wall biosynthesis
MSLPRLSVILPTYNRAGSLRHAIKSLLRQMSGTPPYEVIVVNNNSSDGTPQLLASIDDPKLRSVTETVQGLSHARDRGLALAGGDIVAFTDDDVEVAADWARTIVEALDANPRVDGVAGRVLPCLTDERPRWLSPARVFDRGAPAEAIGTNVAFRRSVLDRSGRFSPDVLYLPRLLVVAPVHPERTRHAHWRWHEGHGDRAFAAELRHRMGAVARAHNAR